MVKPRFLLFGLLAVMLGIAGACSVWPTAAITRANAAKIRSGMTLAEVEDVFGGPARNDSWGPVAADLHADPGEEKIRELEHTVASLVTDAKLHMLPAPLCWQSSEVAVHVFPNEASQVWVCLTVPMRYSLASPRITNFCRWAGGLRP